MISQLKRFFLENPLIGRQISTQLTGPRLGLIFVFATGALLLADVITFSAVLLSDDASVSEGYAGAHLSSVNFLVLLGLLVVLLPIRLAGAIDGPRMDKVFDQVVVTGVSPLRIQLGNWLLAWVFALGLLLVSLPFQLYSYMLGGVPFWSLWGGYAVLAVYSNVIIAVSLGMFLLEREWIGVPATIFTFGLGMLLGFAPVPNVIGWITPVRCFVSELYQNTLFSRLWDSDAVLYLYRIPTEIYPYLLWGIVSAPFVGLVLLGPAHRFLPGLNNFGNIVLAGDGKRRFFRKARFTQTRRVEIAFFYENRPRWLDGFDYPLRRVLLIGWIIFLWAAILGLCFDGAPRIQAGGLRLDANPHIVLSILGTSLVLFLGLLALGDAREKLTWTERIGRFKVSRGVFQANTLLFLIVVFLAQHWGVLQCALKSVGPSMAAPQPAALERFERAWHELLGAITIFVVNTYLLGRVVARFVETQAALRFVILLSAGAVLIGPPLLLMGLGEGWLPRGLYPFIFVTPILTLLVQDSMAPRLDPDEAFGRYLTWHGGIAAIFLLALGAIILADWTIWTRRNLPKRPESPPSGPAAGPAVVVLLFIALLGPCTNTARAQQPELPLKLDLTYGFNGRLFETNGVESPSFFTLVLENSSGREIRGTLRLELRGGEAPPPRPFVAPAGTRTALRWSEGFEWGRQIRSGGGTIALVAPEGVIELAIPVPGLLSRNSRQETRNYLLVSEDKERIARARTQGENWMVTPAFWLPEDPRAYKQVDTVLVQWADLSRWTRAQRQALLDFVRWGGAVVFFGSMDPGTAQSIEGWSTLLAVRRSARVDVAGTLVCLEELEDSTQWGEIDTRAEPSKLPILSVRPVAFGRVAHLSLDPTVLSLNQELWNSIWSEGMPRSEYLSGLSRSTPELLELRDSTSLFAVLGFFVAYVFLVGPLGFFALRRRLRRKWIPLWILVLPSGFVALLPVLHASLHLRPSFATLTRVAFFGSGARHGVAFARIDLRSSGRQEHALYCQGRGLSAFSVEMESSRNRWSPGLASAELVPLAISSVDGGVARLDIHAQPWGRRQIHLLGEAVLKQPLTGSATYSSLARRLSITVQGFSPAQRKLSGDAILRLPGENMTRSAALEQGKLEGGTFTLPLAFDSASGVFDEPGLDLPSRPAVYLALDQLDVGISVHSRDLAFERELPELAVRATKPPTLPAEFIERDGKIFRSFARSLVIIELPLETK